jgi:hypothetical protein
MSDSPLSSFKKLIVSTPRLLHGLHTMSLVKAAPEGLKDLECKRITLRECPPIPYVPKKDSVEEMVSSLKAESLKTQISKRKEVQVSFWHSGTREAFLMHVGSALNAIKKRGPFKAHKEANEAYVEQRNLVKQAKAALAKIDRTTSKGARTSKKSSNKHKEASVTANAPEPHLQAMYQLDLKKARDTAENANAKAESAAQDMFQFYTNLLSVDAKYAWNKIVQEYRPRRHFQEKT